MSSMQAHVALLRAPVIKKRLAGAIGVLDELQNAGQQRVSSIDEETLAPLLPDVLSCLKEHNPKLAHTALEIIELVLPRLRSEVVTSREKELWNALSQRMGDGKVGVREKAVDVIVQLASHNGLDATLSRLKPCFSHRNWRVREQSLHCLWRCLDKFDQFSEKKSEWLDTVVAMLEDSSKEVRDSALETLVRFYFALGPDFIQELEAKNLRSQHLQILHDHINDTDAPYHARRTPSPSYQQRPHSSPAPIERYFSAESPIETVDVSAIDIQTPQVDQSNSFERDITVRMVEQEIVAIRENLDRTQDWSKRVEALRSVRTLAGKCVGDQELIEALSNGLRQIRDLLCAQVGDLRSAVAKEACLTIQYLAQVLQEEFNGHAEKCIESLLKATYVTIQVVSSAADTAIRRVIESTEVGYARVLTKVCEGSKARSHALRTCCASYLTLALQRWSLSYLSKHTDILSSILPSLIQDAVSKVRANARQCYWCFHALFPEEASTVFQKLDRSTQKALLEDPSRSDIASTSDRTSSAAMSMKTASTGKRPTALPPRPQTTATSSSSSVVQKADKSAKRVPVSGPSSVSSDSRRDGHIGAQRVLVPSSSDKVDDSKNVKSTYTGPLRVEVGDKPVNATERRQMISQAALRVPVTFAADQMTAKTSTKTSAARFHSSEKPLRVVENTKKENKRASPHSSEQHDAARDAKRSKPPADQPSETRARKLDSNANSFETLEEAVAALKEDAWYPRLLAVKYIGSTLIHSNRPDDRTLHVFIQSLADPHERVTQQVLSQLPTVLRICRVSQVEKQLKYMLSRLFQKLVDPKETPRALAKESLELIASLVDTSVLMTNVVPLVTQGRNMKMKASVCDFIRERLVDADVYFQQATSNMRMLLTKVAQVVEDEAPLAVVKACGKLIQALAELYPSELNDMLSLLPPSKRSTLHQLMTSRGIVIHMPSMDKENQEEEQASPTKYADNQEHEAKEHAKMDYVHTERSFKSMVGALQQENLTHEQRLRHLHNALFYMKQTSAEEDMEALVYTLLNDVLEQDVLIGIRGVEWLVKEHANQVSEYSYPIFLRLLEILDRLPSDHIAAYLTENVLQQIGNTFENAEETVRLLAPYLAQTQQPTTLQVVQRLLTYVMFRCGEKGSAFLRSTEWMDRLMGPLTDNMSHTKAEVRKGAVDAVVALYGAMGDNAHAVEWYLTDRLPPVKQRLVQVYLQRVRS